MNSSKHKGGGVPRGVLFAAPLAILSSVGSIAVAVVGGWQRGEVMPGQLLLPGVNVIAVMGALLLPTLWGRIPGVLKAWCIALWLLCMCWAVQGHAGFLLYTQERAAGARTEAVRLQQTPLPPSGRSPATILNDKAKLIEQLAQMSRGACEVASCVDRHRLRIAAVTQRLDALDAEARSVAEIHESRLRQADEQRRAQDDLVGIRLASSFRVPYVNVTGVMSLAFAFILEGLGCFCWAVVFRVEPTASVAQSVTTDGDVVTAVSKTVTTVPPAVTSVTQVGMTGGLEVTLVPTMKEVRDFAGDCPRVMLGRTRQLDHDVARVNQAVRDSEIIATVKRIRDFLGCGQDHARQVAKVIRDMSVTP